MQFLIILCIILIYGCLTGIALLSSVLSLLFFLSGSFGAGVLFASITFVFFCLLIYLDTPMR